VDESQLFVGPGGVEREVALAQLIEVLKVGLNFKYRDRWLTEPVERSRTDWMTQAPLPVTGSSLSAVVGELETRYLPHFANLATPKFAGFPDAGNSLAGLAGAIMSDLLNANMINSVLTAPGATEIEMNVIRWLRQLVGFADEGDRSSIDSAFTCGGVPTQGGTGANFVATLLAIARARQRQGESGVTDGENVVIVPAEIGHYTMEAAASWAGLGQQAVVEAPITAFRYDLPALRRLLASLREEGRNLLLLVAYAGDSRTMTIDALDEVAFAVREYFPYAWLHCDGCHGTSLIFSDQHRRRLDGMQKFDSVSLDPHKVLSVPYTCSFLLVRRTSDLELIATSSELILRQARSMGQITPTQGSRAFATLRLWFLLRVHGVTGLGAIIDTRLRLAQHFADLVDQEPRLARMNTVDLNSVTFVVLPPGTQPPLTSTQLAMAETLTRATYDRMIQDGEYYLHSFLLPDNRRALSSRGGGKHTVLRYMSGNPLIDEPLHEALISHVVNVAG